MQKHSKFALALFLTALLALALVALMVYLYTKPQTIKKTKNEGPDSGHILQSFFHNLTETGQSFFNK